MNGSIVNPTPVVTAYVMRVKTPLTAPLIAVLLLVQHLVPLLAPLLPALPLAPQLLVPLLAPLLPALPLAPLLLVQHLALLPALLPAQLLVLLQVVLVDQALLPDLLVDLQDNIAALLVVLQYVVNVVGTVIVHQEIIVILQPTHVYLQAAPPAALHLLLVETLAMIVLVTAAQQSLAVAHSLIFIAVIQELVMILV